MMYYLRTCGDAFDASNIIYDDMMHAVEAWLLSIMEMEAAAADGCGLAA
jgi:hypothetical protein